ncbi:copper resistance CopC family protein [Clavibacter zhangzhiyongii]|uniref:Copper resistance protein CopC n=1 Tax=Clavibacter zhangzhiyongii TaxID=2768071 RepID=A0A7L7YYZ2_9MICO|nr:copper resistance protein CopC [Clavibacter zhangzhiyongii]QOD42659.1 copper resistance protein CopC [Clavibacter zhangzhiyongii]
MTPHNHPRRRSRVRRAARVLLPAVALAITSAVAPGPTSAAWAHDSIISTTPADGGHVETAPSEVSMLYTDSLIGVGAAVVVVDQDGTDWADGPVTLAGTDAVQPLRAGMPDGMYEVRWRVVSSDGHPIAGTYAFAVGEADSAAAPAEAAADSAAAATPPPEVIAEDASAPSAPADEAAAPDDASSRTATTVGVGTIGALLGIGIFAAAVKYGRRRRTS